jgi:peptidoglycan/LPS O-acetylase OafA/YrhL
MPHLDGLRAIAVLSVIFFHLGIPGFKGGFIGVDVFLVISGFLITNIIKQEIVATGTFSFTSFYKKRIRRLAPALLCVLVATTFFGSLFLSTSLLKAYGGELFSSIFGVSNIFFWKQVDYFDLSSKLKPLLHTWSLSVEWQFYLIWSFIVAFLYKSKFKSIALFVGVIFLLSLILNFYQVPDPANKFFPIELQDRKSTIFYLIPFRVFEFCIGAYLVETLHKIKIRRIYSDILSFFGICLILISVYFYSDSLIFPSYFALAPCLGAAMLILFGGRGSIISIFLENKLLVGIGIISYSLYLVHWPVIVFYDYLTYNPNEIARLLTILFITLLSSFFLWKFIEFPFRKKCSLFLISALAFCMSALGFYLFYFSDGWTWRIPNKELLNGIENINDFHKKYYGGIQYSKIPTSSSVDADILLLGDSHGAHYAEGLYKEVALPSGLSLHIQAGISCFHLPGFVRVRDEYDGISAAENIQRHIDKRCSNSKKPLLIISHSWLFQQSKGVFLDKNGSSKSSPIQIMHILNSITELKNRTGAPILVIGEVPGENGPSCFEELQRPKFGRRFSFDQLSSSNPDEIRFKFNFEMAEYANKTGDFYFIDPGLALLDNGKYRNFDLNGNPIYSDAYHLSVFGSRFVISHFKDEILKHINENSLK